MNNITKAILMFAAAYAGFVQSSGGADQADQSAASAKPPQGVEVIIAATNRTWMAGAVAEIQLRIRNASAEDLRVPPAYWYYDQPGIPDSEVSLVGSAGKI